MDASQSALVHGGPIKQYNIPDIWARLSLTSDMPKRKAAIAAFNAANTWKKRGISMVPMRYPFNWGFAAGANVQVCIQAAEAQFGIPPSVTVFQPCIEMGQGLTTKIQQMVATTLGCSFEQIFVKPTDTDVLPNGGSGVTGGSVASEACSEVSPSYGHY